MQRKKDKGVKKDKRAVGRPSVYSEEIAQEICDTIATHPYSIMKLCDMFPHWPKDTTILAWGNKYPEFSSRYLEAKRRQIHTRMEYAHKLMEDVDRKEKSAVQLITAQVNLYKWEASRLLPKLYGDNTYLEEQSKPEIQQLTDIINKLISKHQKDY